MRNLFRAFAVLATIATATACGDDGAESATDSAAETEDSAAA